MAARVSDLIVPSKIVRAAKAICVARGIDPDGVNGQAQPAWTDWISVAKAAHAALSVNDDGERLLNVTVDEARRLCKRLEFDASWDKAGSGYYALKRQLQSDEGSDTQPTRKSL